ncbi:MAG TPA: alanine racemase [Thermoanaerobaculia bacterium]|nr:alanine racemase [Thermoanaerobaculia bacterium]
MLEANLGRMQRRAEALGVALRPHAKTHKCVEVARRQLALGARGLTVATLHEAAAFAAAGILDITWAFPLIPSRLPEARRLADGGGGEHEPVTLRLVVDSPEAVAALEAEAAAGDRRPFHVFLKVDCGYHRAGVDPGSARAVELARRLAASPHAVFDGLLSHSGHAYRAGSRQEAAAIAEEERRVVVGLAERLRSAGIAVPEVSVGSTPAMAAVERLDGATEARPGNYAFYDGTQAALGSCRPQDCAVTVLTTVVSCQPGAGHAVVDAGALALSKDAGPDHLPWPWGLGAVFRDLAAYRAGRRDPELHLVSLSQEHGITSAPAPVHARFRVLPNHSCLVVPNFDFYTVVRGDEVVDRWPVITGRDA